MRSSVNVPPNSAQGRKLRLKGKGIPGKPPGDFYCVLRIVLPPADSPEARQLYRQMEEKFSFDPRADLKGAGR
jgi:curved DNA-binding protein